MAACTLFALLFLLRIAELLHHIVINLRVGLYVVCTHIHTFNLVEDDDYYQLSYFPVMYAICCLRYERFLLQYSLCISSNI